MTVRNEAIRRISGIALLALFLTFVSVPAYPGTEEEADDNRLDESRLNVPTEPAVPIIVRTTKLAAGGGFVDKAYSGISPSTSASVWHTLVTLRTAVKKSIPQLLSNPFYVVLTAKAP
jgi:predicted MFS family arabinose efflux permease